MKKLLLFAALIFCSMAIRSQKEKFNDGWTVRVDTANNWNENDIWKKPAVPVTLPHDWSIEQPFDKYSTGGNRGASLRGGLGIYEKKFVADDSYKNKNVFIIFDGVYMNSTVAINGHTLGTRPFGYISFEYDITSFLKFNGQENIITVRAENKQPNSRWYSGSGIYRNVWMDKRGPVYVKNWNTYITTPEVSNNKALVNISAALVSTSREKDVTLKTSVFAPDGKLLQAFTDNIGAQEGVQNISKNLTIERPQLWNTETPHLYKALFEVMIDDAPVHTCTTNFGIRYFRFDKEKGFFLNDKYTKIFGACMHHDLGALGAAINVRAMERQLQILKGMGINGIRTAHNPPAPEWLDLCDKMGFLVMDETFDAWTWDKENTPYNYNLYYNQWHEKDLADHILRDRNHPSVIMWSIGNEIPEQRGEGADTIGRNITRELVRIIKKYDDTRPVSAGMNFTNNKNNMYLSDALDVIGINYHHKEWEGLGTTLFPGNKPYLLAENISPLATRGVYDMPSDSIRRWAGFTDARPGGNKDFTASAYENVSVPWGSTNEEALKLFLKHRYLSGMYLWTGFDYLGEPTPYPFPARSSYFGIVDMAGFPKDSYFLYKSLFTKDNVLHILPHWNWTPGQKIDVHVYFNNADEVQLFLNGKLLAKKSKQGDELFVRFNGITYQPGTLKAVSTLKGKKVMESVVKTAGAPYKIVAEPDRSILNADGEDLCFVKVSIVDKKGNLVPKANPKLDFSISGAGSIAALDNGYQADLEPYTNKKYRNAYNGLALAIVKPAKEKGGIRLHVSAAGLQSATVNLTAK